jgi:glycerophosphoryl diester phosphodiesterase
MKIIGHRGARGEVAENTLAAFQFALAHGVDGVEFDLRQTSDGVVVVCHDAFITTADGAQLPIATTPSHELAAKAPDLLLFQDVLRTLPVTVPMMLEIKPNVPINAIVAEIRRQLNEGRAMDTLEIASFDQKILQEIKKQLPGTPLVVIEIWSSWRARRRAHALGTKKISLLEYWVWPSFIRAMTRAGYELYVYPSTNEVKKRRFRRFGFRGCTESPDRARRWSQAGLAGIITDHPELFDS